MNLADFGRFSDPALLILASLADQPRHGYAMMTDIRTLTGVRLGPGTLYGALARLEKSGLIKPLPARDRRRPYQLTAKGATALRQQLAILQELSSAGLREAGRFMKLHIWLIGLYPSSWRERYGEEFGALLEQSLQTPLDVLDILLGALDAHLGFASAIDRRSINMLNKLRTAILLVFVAYIAFIVAGMSVYGFADDSLFIPMMRTNPALLIAWTTIQVGAVVALAAVVIGGTPLAWTIVRRALTSNRKELRLLLVPVYAFLAFSLYLIGMSYLSVRTPILSPPVSPVGRALMWGLIAAFVLGAIASAAAVWRVVSRSDVQQGSLPLLASSRLINLYEFAVIPAIVATLAMLGMLAATIAWFWLAFSARPDILAGNEGPMMTDSRLAMWGTLILMAAAVAAACSGLARIPSARGQPGARA